jgi:hypothetical protein
VPLDQPNSAGVDERLPDDPLGAVVADRGLALALAHLRPVGVEDERQVGEGRLRIAERAEQEDVLRRVREMVLAPDHVADAHRRIVDDDREVVERRAVGPDDDEVAAQGTRVDLDVAADDVVEGDHAPTERMSAPDPRPRRPPFGGVRCAQRPT